jgi:hypothetical protein
LMRIGELVLCALPGGGEGIRLKIKRHAG